MGAGGDFGYHSAKTGMQISLGDDNRRQDLAAMTGRMAHNRRRSVVAGTFQPQNDKCVVHIGPVARVALRS